MWLLDPLVWEGEQIYPLLVIAFRDQAAMERSLHNTSIEASFASNAAAIRGAELWLRTLLGCPRIVLCDVNESAAALVHEFAHWLCCEWYERVGGHGFYHAPNFIVEGMAEVTAGQFRSVSRRDDDYVGEWLQSNRLADGVYGDDKYVIGESFVRYLVDVLTPEGFFETLGDWGSRPAELIEEYEPGWRASIGLPRECITE